MMKRTKAPSMVRTKKSKPADTTQRTKAPAMKRTKKGEGKPSLPTLHRTKAPGMVRTKKKSDNKHNTKPKNKQEVRKRQPGQPPHLTFPGHMPNPPSTCTKRKAFQDDHGTEYIDNTTCAECKHRCQRREDYYREWVQYKQELKGEKHK